MEKKILIPKEIAEFAVETGIKKTSSKALDLFILGILAGSFIAFASAGSNSAAFNLLSKPETYGIGKALSGALFGTGLMLVIIAGGELFTGNMLIIVGVLDRKIKISKMLRNWTYVYLGNFLGALLVAFMIVYSGLLNSGSNLLGGVTIKIASSKIGLTFSQAIILGMMCNFLVCLAVWMSYAAKDVSGKILSIFFPIWLFVTSGFEHSIANMYYIPAGILAKSNENWVQASHLSLDKISSLNWGNFFIKNLLPVTIGNIIGGTVFVGLAYWSVYLKKGKTAEINCENNNIKG
ncbi:formate/nitrite transporter [Caloramator quimbayensis]|uniref:Formate/nitrite transporter n=1 Tax=Caloramator quimbayensis TaxID=1147123 RepID=A0A1T4XHC9_9CLOT|nr:formate/nitrite transporter family protein [Caloramator quimbayensis]SKA88930.1 formate/nitrite transporter [Caloramator quimbayensis]